MFDIDSNGQLNLWSPWANSETLAMAEASMELPFPTGREITLEETEDFGTINSFLEQFSSLFDISKSDKKGFKISLRNNQDVSKLRLLGDFLKLESIPMPSRSIYQDIAFKLRDLYPTLKVTSKELESVFNKFKEVINKHNTYLNNLPKFKLQKVLNNYIVSSLYSVIQDPVNQVQAQTSVDATTGPLKEIAEASSEAKAAHKRTPGSWVNKLESIVENQVGKDCIGISAVGLKAFFALTEYSNIVLNSGDSEAQERLIGQSILSEEDYEAIQNGRTPEEKDQIRKTIAENHINTTLANIRAKNVESITNDDVLALLTAVQDSQKDAALVLSALLSLSTD